MTEKEFVQWQVDEYNKAVGNLNESDGYDCVICKNKGFTSMVKYNEFIKSHFETLVPCKCARIRSAIKRLNRSGLKNIVKDYTFDNYKCETAWQDNVKFYAMRFCKDNENNWFFIGGQSGAGKTHLCTAIAVHYIRTGKEMRYMLWRDEISRIKASMNDDAGDMIKELKETQVLYIDDLFKMGKDEDGRVKMPTASDVNIAFEILNYRLLNPELITIISSERTLVELNQIDEAIAGRIAEKTKDAGYCLNIKKDPSRNWRMKGIQEV